MGKSDTELELKLTGAPDDVAALRRSRLFRKARARDAAEPGWERLVSTYYDTEDRKLERAGASLRLREEAGGRVQTMKRASVGALGRLEEEFALAAEEVFPRSPHTDEFAALLSGAASSLKPVARTVTDRYAAMLERGGALIEASIDLGRAEGWQGGAPFAAAPLAEAEFELLSGPTDALFRTARRCLEESEGRLRLSIAAKADQARRLARPFTPIGPEETLDLDPNIAAGDALSAGLVECAKRIIECAPAITELRASEGVHQMRVALRRFRAIERIYRRAANDAELQRLAKAARGFARLLGKARDWDVFLSETLPKKLPGDYAADGLSAIRARAEALRARAWDRAARKVASLDFSLFALDLLAAAHSGDLRKGRGLDEPVKAFAARALDRRLKESRAVAAGIDDAAPEARHPLRIELKKLRYAAQTFRSLYPKASRKTYLSAMSRLQDAFGALNDAVVAQTLANEAAVGQGREAARAAGFIAGWRAGEAEARASEVGVAWRAFAALTPFWRDGD